METKKLLLVDDVALFLQLEKTFLTRRSFVIHTARNGDEALKKARQIEPDVIVLDLHMPGMDGDILCRLLKGDPQTSSIPVIMLSAAQDDGDRRRCLEAGCQAYITKPIKKDELCRTVEEQLNIATRAHRRVAVSWPCVVRDGERETGGVLRNLSEGGAFLTLEGVLHAGRTIRLQFQIPGRSGISNVSAKVCWAGRECDGGPEGVGVKFQVVSAADVRAISDHVKMAEADDPGSARHCEGTADRRETLTERNW